MPTLHTEDVYFTTLACIRERKNFKTDRQRQMFKKLHYKKCETCRNAPRVVLGLNQVSYTETALNMVYAMEQMDRQEEEITRFLIN